MSSNSIYDNDMDYMLVILIIKKKNDFDK